MYSNYALLKCLLSIADQRGEIEEVCMYPNGYMRVTTVTSDGTRFSLFHSSIKDEEAVENAE